MEKALKQAKSLAKTLLKQVKAGDKKALLRFKKHYRNEKLCAETIKLVQCQHCIASEIGFDDWQQLQCLLCGIPNGLTPRFGTLFHSGRCDYFINKWFANYPEAQANLNSGDYLVPYQQQFIVVRSHYLDALGIKDMHQLSNFDNDLTKAYPSDTWDCLVAQIFAAKRQQYLS